MQLHIQRPVTSVVPMKSSNLADLRVWILVRNQRHLSVLWLVSLAIHADPSEIFLSMLWRLFWPTFCYRDARSVASVNQATWETDRTSASLPANVKFLRHADIDNCTGKKRKIIHSPADRCNLLYRYLHSVTPTE